MSEIVEVVLYLAVAAFTWWFCHDQMRIKFELVKGTPQYKEFQDERWSDPIPYCFAAMWPIYLPIMCLIAFLANVCGVDI